MAFTPSTLRQIHDCLDRMAKRMDELETNRQARWDAEDRERDITNPLDEPIQAPFSDSLPEMAKEPLWDGKPPVPIEHI